MPTVWIPLDHVITEEDSASARRMGESFNREASRGIASFAAIETSVDHVGVMLIGRDAEKMLQQIRAYFQQHCPRGTYVTRRRLQRGRDLPLTWSQPRPLFEGDQIPEN